MSDYVYDIESYPNVFLITFKEGDNWWTFEISNRRNDYDSIVQMILVLQSRGDRMVGYNNFGYDYPVLHFVLDRQPTAEQIYQKSISIIFASKDERFTHTIWDNNQYVPQIDLFKIHHFDNIAKMTSLKMLEFNMRSMSIQELPFPPGTYLTSEQIDVLIDYNQHDVNETDKFFEYSIDAINFREELSEKYGNNFLNFNDTKIGKQYIIQELEKVNPRSCYVKHQGRRTPVQTPREFIRIADVILPCVQLEHPEFQRVKNWLEAQIITETKGIFEKLSCTINGFQFDFGTGGIHGSVDSQTVCNGNGYTLIDVDVAGYYPSLAVVNRLRPAHLGELFCDVYADVVNQRKSYKKGTPENAMLKLASNGTYGDSNNKYSPFYDPQYTMTITINGQLLLCMLSEQVMKIPGLRMIQINTDGLTVLCPDQYTDHLRNICRWWESVTGLELEEAIYSRMFIRDVNNYLAEGEDGKLKRKGAYGYEAAWENPSTQELGWHKNHSSRVVAKAAEAALVHGRDIAEFIWNHDDPMDFMLRTKVPKSSYLLHGERRVQNITRYYISRDGQPLTKVMPPLKGKDVERKIGINVGWKVTECNNWNGTVPEIDYRFYIQEAEKLVKPLQGRC